MSNEPTQSIQHRCPRMREHMYPVTGNPLPIPCDECYSFRQIALPMPTFHQPTPGFSGESMTGIQRVLMTEPHDGHGADEICPGCPHTVEPDEHAVEVALEQVERANWSENSAPRMLAAEVRRLRKERVAGLEPRTDDLAERLRRAVARLEDRLARCFAGGMVERARLEGKIEGVKLAASYLDEGERIFLPKIEGDQ